MRYELTRVYPCQYTARLYRLEEIYTTKDYI